MAILSKELVKIVCDLKLKYSYDEASYQLKLTPEVEAFLNKVGFRTWLTKLADYKVVLPLADKPVYVPPAQTTARTVERWTLADFKKNIQGIDIVAITHVCDDDLNQHQCWRGMGVATSKATGYLTLSEEEAKTLVDILHEGHALVICYQSKPILQLAMVAGINPDFKYFDLAQAHFNLNPEYRHDLATITEEFLGYKIAATAKGQTDLFGGNTDEDLKHQGEKAEAIFKLYPILRAKMKEMNVERPYDELDIPLIKVLASMELEGVTLDIGFYKELENEFSTQIAEIEKEVFKTAGDKINLRSPKQVGEFLLRNFSSRLFVKPKLVIQLMLTF